MDRKYLMAGGIAAVISVLAGNEAIQMNERQQTVAEYKNVSATAIAKLRVGDEIRGKRTANSETFKGDSVLVTLNDGSKEKRVQYQSRVYAAQKYFKDADVDTLRPLDLTVHEISALAKLNPFRTHDKYVDSGNYRATWFNDKPGDINMEVDNVSVSFKAIYDAKNIDIKMDATPDGMKETLTLADADAAHTLRWVIETDGSLVAQADNGYDVRAKDGSTPMQIERPRAWDAAGKPVMAVASVEGDTLTFRVTVLPGQEYPVTVDPSTVVEVTAAQAGSASSGNGATYLTQRNLADATVTSASTNDYEIYSWLSAPNYNVHRAFMTFDTSSLGSEAAIDSAKVVMRVHTNSMIDADSLYIINGTFSGPLAVGWYNDFTGWASSGAYTLTKLAPGIHTGAFATGDTIRFTLNAAGLADIAKTDTTRYAFITENDRAATPPTTTNELYIYGASYIQIWYAGLYQPVPTAFTLATPTTTTLAATWTNHHSTGIDSLRIFTGANVWQKTLVETDQSTSITGLTPNTSYIFKVRVDSVGTVGYSNADTLYTLAAAPTTLAFTEVDSLHLTFTFSGGSNPAGTLYALRDSLRQRWFDAAGDTTSTKTWRTEAQWEAITLTVLKDVVERIGVVGKNEDGVETAYLWGTQSTNNKKTFLISASTEWHKQATDAIYTLARGLITTAVTDAGSGEIGMSKPASYVITRAGFRILIPAADSITAAKLISTGTGDASTTNFSMNVFKSTWLYNGVDDHKYWKFNGYQTDSTAYNGTNLIAAWTTDGNYAAGANADTMTFTAAALDTMELALGDTIGFQLVSSRDVSSTVPSGDEYIGLTTFKILLTYWKWDNIPTSVVVTSIAGAPDSLLVTWTNNALTATRFRLVDAYTGTALGGNDSTASTTAVKRMGGFTPNSKHNIAIKVVGGKIDGQVSTASDSAYTRAAVLGKPTVTMLGTTTALTPYRKIVIDTVGLGPNILTRIALNDSVTGKFVMWVSGADDTMRTGTVDSSWVWRTFANWGSSNGDTIRYPVGHWSVFRTYTKSGI